MFCSKCGYKNPENSNFCKNCGNAMPTKVKENTFTPPVAPQNNNTNQNAQSKPVQDKTKKPAKKGKGCIVAIIVAVVIAVVFLIATICGCVYLVNTFLTKSDTELFSSEFSSMVEESNQLASEVNELSAFVLENVQSDSQYITESHCDSLQSLLDDKNANSNFVYSIIITDDNSDLQSYADNMCSEISQGADKHVVIAYDAENCTYAFSTTGDASELLTEKVLTVIDKNVETYIKDNDHYSTCVELINTIPNTKKEARAYNFDPVDGAQQVVYVNVTSGTKAKMTVIDWSGSTPINLMETSDVYVGMDGITDSPSESKSATPKGTFSLGFAMSDKQLNTKLDFVKITKNMVWVDDTSSKYYNTLQQGSTKTSNWKSAENTYANFTSLNFYDACILIEHNGDGYTKGTAGKGSAMFIAGKEKGISTSYGDINISKEDMTTLLSLLDESKNPHIVIG